MVCLSLPHSYITFFTYQIILYLGQLNLKRYSGLSANRKISGSSACPCVLGQDTESINQSINKLYMKSRSRPVMYFDCFGQINAQMCANSLKFFLPYSFCTAQTAK